MKLFAKNTLNRLNAMTVAYMARTGMLLSAVPLTVDSIDKVPEAQRSLYVEKDGKFVLDVDGLEDTSGLKNALAAEREAVKKAKRESAEALKRYEGIDPDKVRTIMQRLDTDEEAALVAAGKIDEVISKRTEKLRLSLQQQVEEANKAVQAANGRADKFSQRVLDNHIRSAALKAGLHQHAIDDALFRARSMFSLTEDGEAVQLGSDGAPILGKDGKSPFTPVEWLESMKESAPHWFPAGAGGGGGGGGGRNAGSGNTISRAKFNALSAAEKATIAKTHTITD